MNANEHGDVRVGDVLPGLEAGPISRLDLALYCGASGDHNPIHVDVDFARRAGRDDVIAHGMLSMAWLGRMLTQWVPQSALRRFGVRFVATTQVGECIRCSGRVAEIFDVDGERRARIELHARNQDDQPRLGGEAVIALHSSKLPTRTNR